MKTSEKQLEIGVICDTPDKIKPDPILSRISNLVATRILTSLIVLLPVSDLHAKSMLCTAISPTQLNNLNYTKVPQLSSSLEAVNILNLKIKELRGLLYKIYFQSSAEINPNDIFSRQHGFTNYDISDYLSNNVDLSNLVSIKAYLESDEYMGLAISHSGEITEVVDLNSVSSIEALYQNVKNNGELLALFKEKVKNSLDNLLAKDSNENEVLTDLFDWDNIFVFLSEISEVEGVKDIYAPLVYEFATQSDDKYLLAVAKWIFSGAKIEVGLSSVDDDKKAVLALISGNSEEYMQYAKDMGGVISAPSTVNFASNEGFVNDFNLVRSDIVEFRNSIENALSVSPDVLYSLTEKLESFNYESFTDLEQQIIANEIFKTISALILSFEEGLEQKVRQVQSVLRNKSMLNCVELSHELIKLVVSANQIQKNDPVTYNKIFGDLEVESFLAKSLKTLDDDDLIIFLGKLEDYNLKPSEELGKVFSAGYNSPNEKVVVAAVEATILIYNDFEQATSFMNGKVSNGFWVKEMRTINSFPIADCTLLAFNDWVAKLPLMNIGAPVVDDEFPNNSDEIQQIIANINVEALLTNPVFLENMITILLNNYDQIFYSYNETPKQETIKHLFGDLMGKKKAIWWSSTKQMIVHDLIEKGRPYLSDTGNLKKIMDSINEIAKEKIQELSDEEKKAFIEFLEKFEKGIQAFLDDSEGSSDWASGNLLESSELDITEHATLFAYRRSNENPEIVVKWLEIIQDLKVIVSESIEKDKDTV